MRFNKHKSFDYSGYSKSDIYEILSECQDELLEEKEEHVSTMEELLKEKQINQKLQREIEILKKQNNVFKL